MTTNRPPSPIAHPHSYYDERWTQLNNMVIANSEGALTYLLIVNGGALAGLLAFVGAVNEVRTASSTVCGLALFGLGLVLAGVARAANLHYFEWLKESWRADFWTSYYTGQITWDELIRRDNMRVKREWILKALGYSSFSCFLVGLVISSRLLLSLTGNAS